MSGSASDLDIEFLEELLDGDREFAQELLETYCESSTSNLAEAKQLLKAGENEKLYLPFHTLKGSSASIGLVGVRDLAKEFELDAREGRFARCLERLEELSRAVAAGREAFKEFLETL